MIVSYPFNFTDEEIVDHYMSYLKGLAINMPKMLLIKFLLNKQFSLFAGAMMFFNYKETLIKTASRTIILTVIKRNRNVVNHKIINHFILESGFFFHLVNQFKLNFCALKTFVNKNSKSDSAMNDLLDILYYMNDIYEQDLLDMNEKLTNEFILNIIPLFINFYSLERKSFSLTLVVLTHIFHIINSPFFVNIIGILFLSVQLPIQLSFIVDEKNYCFKDLDYDFENCVENPVFSWFVDGIRGKGLNIENNDLAIRVSFIHVVVCGSAISKELLGRFGLLPQI